MTAIEVFKIVDRGLSQGLGSLAPRERDVFVIVDLDNHLEMEGGFEDHIATSPEKFDWLMDTLARIGDLRSRSIIKSLRQSIDVPMSHTAPMCERYGACREFRLKCLEQYLNSEGFELVWE